MQSKTSFFNKTVYKKNLTRFAPVMILYTLCLVLGLTIMQLDSERIYGNVEINFWFAHYMGQCIQIMAVVNLFLAPLMAMLLFGDLFNSQMCNALHAMPLNRGEYFLTNVLSGLTFSVVPTAIMTLLSIPLLNATCVHNAWQIGLLWFAGTNLEFLCFFGLAVFSVFCTGNRFAMAAVYAALNGGAMVVYGILDMIYTPMLYGVVTPDRWMELLTPIARMVEGTKVEVQNFNELRDLFRGREGEMVANFWVNEGYYDLIVWAAAGVAFLIAAMLLYRRRHLECAGDAIAIPVLKPVFAVACAVCGAVLGILAMEVFFGYNIRRMQYLQYVFLICGLTVGWFAGKMLLERSTRVFGLKNWKGLGILTAALAVSLVMTHFDVFGIEDWVPKAEKVRYVSLSNGGPDYGIDLSEQEDIENIIRLHEMALEDRQEDGDGFPVAYVESLGAFPGRVEIPEGDGFYYGEGGYDQNEPHLYADYIYITYHMESGREVQRDYTIWASLEEGEIVKEYLSRWEVVWKRARMGWYDEFDVDRAYAIQVSGREIPVDPETARDLMDAMKADCEARTMMQDSYYHNGWFPMHNERENTDYNDKSFYVAIYTHTGTDNDRTAADFEIYTDCEHTLNWLKSHDMYPDEILESSVAY